MKKLVFISEFNPLDSTQRSGVPFHIFESAKACFSEVKYIIVKDRRNLFERIKSRLLQWAYKILPTKHFGWYDAMFSIDYSKGYARSVDRDIDCAESTIFLSISPRTVAFLKLKSPLVLWIDNTYETNAMYPSREHICKKSFEEAHFVEKRAFDKALLIFTASEWLSKRIINSHNLEPAKVRVLPRGANLLNPPTDYDVDAAVSARVKQEKLSLLFVNSGTWNVGRKGGPIVVETFRILAKSIPVGLTIIGNIPAELECKLLKEGVHCLGKVNRATSEGELLYRKCLAQAHFMFVPSKADGFGIVYAEAAMFGLPSIAKAIMGVPEAVKDGITGYLLPADTKASDFANLINKLWDDKSSYINLCRSSFRYAKEHFTWEGNIRRIQDGF